MDSGVLGQSWQQLHDFLQSLYAQGAAPPVAAGSDGINPYASAAAYGTSPTGAMPGGGVMDYQATTPGSPGMGYPAMSGPLAMPSRPVTPTPQTAAPARPVTPTPPPRPKSKLDPAKTDLGMNPRFTTVQYGVGGSRGPLSNNPIYTALNLGS